jgi:Na+/melibiose symporter-like transporter
MAWFATKVGKHRACQVACLVYSAALVSIVFLPPGNVWLNMPVNLVTGFVTTGFTALTRAMVADVTDDIRLKQGKERSGLLFSLTTSTAKIATAGGSLGTLIVANLGYDAAARAQNTPEAIQMLTIAFLAGPTVFLALGAFCFIGYGLTPEKAAETRRRLEARDAAQADAD